MKANYEYIKEIFDIAHKTQGASDGGGVIPHLVGFPGIGKTQIVRQYAESIDYLVFTIILGRIPGVDIGGLYVPCPDTKELIHYITGSLLGRVAHASEHKGVMIFFDEIGNANEEQWTAIQSLLEDRQLEGERVPDSVMFVSATNPDESNCGSNQIIQSLMDRLCPIDLEVDVDSWVDWAVQNDVDGRIIAFNLYRNGNALQQFNPDITGAQPSPRGWVKFSEALKCNPSEMAKRTIGNGYVGKAACAEFISFEENANQLATTEEILAKPNKAKVPSEPGSLFAAVSNIIQFVGSTKEKLNHIQTDALITYLDRMPETFALLGFSLSLRSNEKFASSNQFAKFQKKHRGLAQQVGE